MEKSTKNKSSFFRMTTNTDTTLEDGTSKKRESTNRKHTEFEQINARNLLKNVT